MLGRIGRWLQRCWRRYVTHLDRCERLGRNTRDYLGRVADAAKEVPWIPDPNDDEEENDDDPGDLALVRARQDL